MRTAVALACVEHRTIIDTSVCVCVCPVRGVLQVQHRRRARLAIADGTIYEDHEVGEQNLECYRESMRE